jgi:phosphoribosylglycinamide formyltransferase-1
MNRPLPIGVLLSGGGTNLQAIIDAIERKELSAVIKVVISNRADAYGLERARKHGIPTEVISHKDFPSREVFEAELISTLHSYDVTFVILAGFMRLLSPFFIRAFPQRILNIHPALLPAFPGVHAQRQALERGVRITGATVHFVDEKVDHGPIVIQAAVPVYPDDTEETLNARILAQEHRIYPQAIQLYAEGRVVLQGNRVVILNESQSPESTLRSPAPT